MNLIARKQGNGFTGLRKQMNRLLEDFGFLDEAGFGSLMNVGSVPAWDVSETPEALIVKVELPGMDPKEIEISVVGDTLTVKGEKKEEKEEKGKIWRHVERSYGAFSRSMSLPVAVKSDKIEAESKDGVITITLPKSVEALPKKITVKAK